MSKKRMLEREVLKELAQDDPDPTPTTSALPLLNTKMNLYHENINLKSAENELFIKYIYQNKFLIDKKGEWDELKRKRGILRGQFEAANKGIKENNASVSRFRERIREHSGQKCVLSHQLNDLKSEIDWHSSIAVIMQKYVNQYSIFEKFLENVADVSSRFQSVQDILNRFDTLEYTRRETSKILETELEEAAELRRQMTSLIEEKSSQFKRLNNKLILMQVRRKSASERRLYWENALARVQKQLSMGEFETVELQAGCWELARQMAQRRGLAQTELPQDVVKQLEYIQNTILYYKDVVTVANTVRLGLRNTSV